jgi:hypothetical protein
MTAGHILKTGIWESDSMPEKWNLHGVWSEVQIPARPSISDLEFLEARVKSLDGKGSRALILGSTPEYRDLLMKYGIDTTCADYHPSSFNDFRKQMIYEDKSRLADTDWREMGFDEEFDIILGDLSFTMLDVRDWDEVARRMSRALRGGGRSYQRIWIRIPGRFEDLEGLVAEHRKRKSMHPFTSLAYPFSQRFAEKDGSFDPIQVTKTKIKGVLDQGHLTKDEYEAFDSVWGVFKVVMHFPTRQEADEIFSRHSRIDELHFCKEWFRDFCPTYVLSKK